MNAISPFSAGMAQMMQTTRAAAPPQPSQPVQPSAAPVDKDGDHDGSGASKSGGVNILA